MHTFVTRIFPDIDSGFLKDGYNCESVPFIQVLLAILPGLEDFPELAVVLFPPYTSNISFLFRLEVIV